ncbi:hypothetical protein, conserved [Angomonas deanei]|uniref:Reverse transcriptase domain-containing protein n=1 Tax=Angomonas deanei TaxID=59799 RepID=A0A7G2CGX0_9TRYP|nr:hypothetical protein, conserved [Angomonas deanei]
MELWRLIQLKSGVTQAELDARALPTDVKQWPLHLKHTTLVDLNAVRRMTVKTPATHTFLNEALRWLEDPPFPSPLTTYTSRTVKPTMLSHEDIQKAVEMDKFEPCRDPRTGDHIVEFDIGHLPAGYDAVNVFTVPEMKGRRRLITEPLLNAVIDREKLPQVQYPGRLQRRQALRHMKYMIQIDFEAFYDAIGLPEHVRNHFVFRARGATGGYYRLKTLPTGARWSVAVGQAITNTIVDIDTPVTVMTMIDNILIAACDTQEDNFLCAVRSILRRIEEANLLTSPPRDELLAMSDEALLTMSVKDNVFLGEEYTWDGTQRLIRNSIKTISKIELGIAPGKQYSIRSFVSTVSLICFAHHTTRLNPASLYKILSVVRAFYSLVSQGGDWDAPAPPIEEAVMTSLRETGNRLILNEWWEIEAPRRPSYDTHDYDFVIFTDASRGGWGAIVQHQGNGDTWHFQQRWIHKGERGYVPFCEDDWFVDEETPDDLGALPASMRIRNERGLTNSRHSAHAEPRAISVLLTAMMEKGLLQPKMRLAIATDHYAIVAAQRKLNGFGGIGRGYALNKLYELCNSLLVEQAISVTFFYVIGSLNPADTLSRNFGVGDNKDLVWQKDAIQTRLPNLGRLYCPLCEKGTMNRKDKNKRKEMGRLWGK